MPFFSAKPDHNNIRAAAIASRYGHSKATKSASATSHVKDNQSVNTIGDKASNPQSQNITKAQFWPTGPHGRDGEGKGAKGFQLRPPGGGSSDAFVLYYPKAPSFHEQIAMEEQKAHSQVMRQAATAANQNSNQTAATDELTGRKGAAPQPTPKDGTSTSAAAAVPTPCDNTDAILRQPSAIAPFATNPYNMILYQHTASSPSRTQSKVRKLQQQQDDLLLLQQQQQQSEYQRQYSGTRERNSNNNNNNNGKGTTSPQRIPVNREIEIVLQRGGYEYGNGEKTAFEKYQEKLPGGFPVTWQTAKKKSQPEVFLTMKAPAQQPKKRISVAPSSENQKQQQVRPSSESRPPPPRQQNNGNEGFNVYTHHHQQQTKTTTTQPAVRPASARPASARKNTRSDSPSRNTREQRHPPRTGMTPFEKNKILQQEQQEKEAAHKRMLMIQENEQKEEQKRKYHQQLQNLDTSNFEGESEIPPHYSSPCRDGSSKSDKYHKDCVPPPKNKAKNNNNNLLARNTDELPSTSHYDPVNFSIVEDNTNNNDDDHSHSHGCHCVCHAMIQHDNVIAKTMYQRVQNRKILHQVKNFQGASKTGVGACLAWEANAEQDEAINVARHPHLQQKQ